MTPTPTTPAAADNVHRPRSTHSRHRHGRRTPIRVRWGALAVGSTVGIASWATLYVWGAALGCLMASDAAEPLSLANTALAIYGGLAAGLALFVGSAVASRAASVTCTEAGVLHGLAMWGMANITLVVMVGLLGFESGMTLHGPIAHIVHVGAAAVSGGADAMGQSAAGWSMGRSLVGMGLVMLTSLALSVWGGIWGVSKDASEGY